MKMLFALALFLSSIVPASAADPVLAANPEFTLPTKTLEPESRCPAGDRLSQVSQSDCCKGHKGVCGCRAGKIVCCDNSTSATCTCHADSGVEN